MIFPPTSGAMTTWWITVSVFILTGDIKTRVYLFIWCHSTWTESIYVCFTVWEQPISCYCISLQGFSLKTVYFFYERCWIQALKTSYYMGQPLECCVMLTKHLHSEGHKNQQIHCGAKTHFFLLRPYFPILSEDRKHSLKSFQIFSFKKKNYRVSCVFPDYSWLQFIFFENILHSSMVRFHFWKALSWKRVHTRLIYSDCCLLQQTL